ncbi:ABC transporter permease [Alkalicoccobacillus murimartini]|uniref:ABC-2 type transport system permease protein n=1 Tax=Alkalicoccobacillus murimartini TaxID=171685 RepID=A0ABT9YCW6_9BACI|nr:ABC transporter permease [Alkalicoccobacillus murimartini]MDQ0205320.1 ABC-2 type transport system permease protein [Alkalicoccobacillus murimartini]
MKAQQLWQERVQTYWSEAGRYLKLIGNSGFLFTVYFLFIVGSYYYQQILEQLPEQFPTVELFTVVFLFIITRSRVRTFVKEADMVFLLPFEAKMGDYFRSAIRYSFFIQVGIIALALLLLGPLFVLRIGTGTVFWSTLAVLVIAKLWNLLSSWEEQRLQSKQERASHLLLRTLVNVVLLYLLFSQAGIMFVGIMLLLMFALYFLYWKKLGQTYSLKWNHLIQVEESMVMFFYRIANAFTDVPQLRNQVRERTYLSWIIPILTGKHQSVYSYLMSRSFIRANDYLGIYVRLVLVGAFILYILPTGWIQVAVLLVFMHMIMMQISTIWYHYDMNMWVDIYPDEPEGQKKALTLLSLKLLMFAAVLQSIVLFVFGDAVIASVGLAAGLVFAYLGSSTFIHRRKKQAV